MVLTIFLPIQLLITYILKDHSQIVETYYSSGFYQNYSGFMQNVFADVPFSIGDLFYVLLIVFVLWYVIRIFKRKFKLKKSDFFKIGSFLSIIYFWFHLSWGLNYYRFPLHQALDVKKDYSTIELIDFTENLINKANSIHSSLVENDTMEVVFNKTPNDYEKETFQNFKAVSFQGQVVPNQSIKPSLLSLPLTYMGFGGYLNPFTHEAQYNNKVPNYKYPSLIAHEMAHQLGYAKENEANFVSCYINMHSQNQKIKYTGFTYALKFCLNDVYRRSPEDFEALKAKVNPGILKNYKEVQLFWESYKNPVEPLFKNVYGNFLKVNNQPKGIESYNYVVALLVNYFSKNLLP
ncbi:MAG: DUF3810 domain-containing protein [Psychroflexus sp.]